MPKVSVVIPVYNVKPYLEECLDSILKQTLKDIEIIVVDDGSTDGSTDILRRYADSDTRIKLIVQENRGVTAARKAGAALASSPWMGFVDADDFIEPDMYEALLRNSKDCDVVTSAVCYDDGRIEYDCISPGIYNTPEKMQYIRSNLLIFGDSIFGKRSGIITQIWNKLFRSSIAKEVFEEVDEKIFYSENLEFVARFLFKCDSIRITDLCKYHYRQRPGSAVFSTHENILDNISRLYRSLRSVFSICPPPQQREIMEKLQRFITAHYVTKIPEILGFPIKTYFIRYFNPLHYELTNHRIALYGASVVGQSYYIQLLKANNYDLAIWVDKRYDVFQRMWPVRPVEELEQTVFDYVVIAVDKEDLAMSIRAELLDRGIEEDKILWKKPIYIV